MAEMPERDVAELATELAGLAGRIAAQTCQFLVLLGEFDAREGWGQYAGVLSCAHWLSWQCGMSSSTAREHVRVARALRDLPLTQSEFAVGRLSYSKVRAITRVATPEREPELVEIARAGTAAQLDRFCSAVRRTTTLEEVNQRHTRRKLTYTTDEDGSLVLHARCSPEEGAVIMEAILSAQEVLAGDTSNGEEDGKEKDGEGAGAGAGTRDTEQHSLLDALVLVCDQSAVTPAGVSGGGQPRSTRRSETVLHVTLDDLAAATSPTASGTTDATDESPAISAASDHPTAPIPLIGPHLQGGARLHPETARRLACDTGVVLHLHEGASAEAPATVLPAPRPGRTIDVGRRTRNPNAALMRALWHRDQGCVFPACERRMFLQAHHLQHWSDGGATTLDNMVLLCSQHHRLHHEGGFGIDRASTGELEVRSPSGTQVVAIPRIGALFADRARPAEPARPAASASLAAPAGSAEPAGPARPCGSPETAARTSRLRLVRPSGETEPLEYDTPAATAAEPLHLNYAVSVVLGVWEHRGAA